MKRVILESPYAGKNSKELKNHINYARECVKDCLIHGEAAIASHLLYTQEGILNDSNSTERALGIAAGLSWSDVADYVVVYTDMGITKGMSLGIKEHQKNNKKIVFRSLYNTEKNEKSA